MLHAPVMDVAADSTPAGASKWEVYTDEYANIYFYNTVTGESVWELPLDEEDNDKASTSTADDARESDAQRESALGLSTRVDTTAAVKHKDDYSTYEIAIGVIDTVVTMLAKVEQNADTIANSATKHKKIKKKKFVSPAAEVRFKKNQASKEKRNKRIRERMKMSYMNILIPAVDSMIDKKIDASNSNHSNSGHLVSVQKPEHQNVGTLFTLDDSLRWRLEREVQQIKQRRAIRKERHRHKQQVLCLKAQQQMLKDFRTELTRYLLSKIECSPQLRQQRILLLSTPQQLAEMDSKRKKTMEPEILERCTNEQLMAKVSKMKNIQKVFVLIDEVGLGRLHLLQILFGIFTIERSQKYALKLRGLAELINLPEIQKFVVDFVSNSHLKDFAVTMEEFYDFVLIIEEVVDHCTSVKNAVKEAEDEFEAALEAAAVKPGTSLVRARISIVSKKKVEQEIAELRATEAEIRARKEQERRYVFQSDEANPLASKEEWEKNHHHRFIRFDETLPLYCCVCRRRKWEIMRREYEEQESQYRIQWPISFELKFKEEELKLIEKGAAKDAPLTLVEETPTESIPEEIPADAEIVLPSILDAPQVDEIEEETVIREVLRSLVIMTERIMNVDPSTKSKKPKHGVHKKSARDSQTMKAQTKKKGKRAKTLEPGADMALQEVMKTFEREEDTRKCMHSEEVQMMLFLERNRRSLERPLLQVQDMAYNAYIRMLSHIVNPSSFLYRLQFLRCLIFDPPHRLVLQMIDYAENSASDGTCSNYFILQTISCRNECEGNQTFKQHKLVEEKIRSPYVARIVSASKHSFQLFADSGMLVECWPLIFVATEFFPAGTWLHYFEQKYVKNRRENATTAYARMELHLLTIFRELAAGLSALHSVGVLHLNLNLENIYISHFESETIPHVKVSGILALKLAFTEEQLKTGAMQQCINYCLAPPEVIQEKKQVTAKADTWMLGCALYEALMLWQRYQLQEHGIDPSDAERERRETVVHLKKVQDILQELPILASPTVRSLLRMLLQPNPAQRPSMSQVIDYLSFAGKENQMTQGK